MRPKQPIQECIYHRFVYCHSAQHMWLRDKNFDDQIFSLFCLNVGDLSSESR